jgi:hypothetical protein
MESLRIGAKREEEDIEKEEEVNQETERSKKTTIPRN